MRIESPSIKHRQPGLEKVFTGEWEYIKNSEDENHAQIDKYYEFFYLAYLSFLCKISNRSDLTCSLIYDAGRYSGIARAIDDQRHLDVSQRYFKDIAYNVMYNTAGARFGEDLARQKNNAESKIHEYPESARKDSLVQSLKRWFNNK